VAYDSVVAETEVQQARPRCRVHNIAMGDDGRCLLCARERSAPASTTSRNPWPVIGFVMAAFLVLLGAYALKRSLDRPTATADVTTTPDPPPQDAPAAGEEAAIPPPPRPQKPRPEDPERRERELDAEMRRVPITMYGTASCGYCKKAREWFAKNDYRYRERDPEKDKTSLAELEKINPQGQVPTFDIDGFVVVGFAPRNVEVALRQAAKQRLE
jgi:glutaredoxin